MRVRRGSFYVGVFLIAAGAVTVLGAAGALDTAAVAGTLAVLWPLAIIAIGLGLALRRSPAALPAGLLAAMLPGLALGSALVSAPHFDGICSGSRPVSATPETHTGTFGSSANVDLTLDCGRMDVTTQPGSDWRVDAREAGSVHRTNVGSDGASLALDSDTGRHSGLRTGEVEWNIVLPTGPTTNLQATVNAGRATFALGQAQLGTVDLSVNAGDLTADLAGARLSRLDLSVNAGKAAVTLPDASFTGSLDANAGALTVCAPTQLGLRVHATTTLGSSNVNGLVRVGDAWQTPGYDTATNKADLSIETSVGSVTINPQGGCK